MSKNATLSIIKRLIRYINAHLKYIIIAIILSVFSSIVFVMVGPSQISRISDLIMVGLKTKIDTNQIVGIAIFVGIIYLISDLLDYIQGVIMANIAQKISRQLRFDINQKLNKLPLRYFDGQKTGDILSTVTNDVDTIGRTLNQTLFAIISNGSLLLGSLVMMIITNLKMALVAVLTTVFGFVLIGLIAKKSQLYFKQNQQQLADLNAHIEEAYTGQQIINIYNATQIFGGQYQKINHKMFISGFKSQLLSGLMQPLMGFLSNLSYVLVSVTGAMLVLNGKINFGVIVAFMMLVRFFTRPIGQMAQSIASLQPSIAASERVFKLLDAPEMLAEIATQKLPKQSVKGNIEFKNIKFGYQEEMIIDDFNFKVKAGQQIAIVGPTGAGKTTIVNLLMRFYELNSGQILIDGVDIKHMERSKLRQLFAMVLQDTWLFQDTVLENLRYNQIISDQKIKSVCKKVGLDHFVKSLPKSYHTVLTDSDVLSAGEMQLLTIARGILENAPLLILDEATSQVDTRTELLVQKAIAKLTKNKTSFIIAHRLSTIKNADQILVLKKGKIVEHGTHQQLLAKNGFYAELYNSQFEE